MRRVRFSVAMSLDGFIAGPNGESDWIVIDPDIDFGALFGQFDTLVMGRKTYEAAKKMGGGGSMPGMKAIVFSRSLSQADCPDATVSNDPKKLLTKMKRESGKDIWLFGGGELFHSLLSMGLVDTVEIALIPVLLGKGLPLLPAPVSGRKLELTKHQLYPKTGTVLLEYKVH